MWGWVIGVGVMCLIAGFFIGAYLENRMSDRYNGKEEDYPDEYFCEKCQEETWHWVTDKSTERETRGYRTCNKCLTSTAL